MDAYKECLVKRELTPRDSVIEMLLLVGALAWAALGVFVNSLAFLGAALFVVLWYGHVYMKNLEFEYTLVESSLRIDVIYNRRKRKSVGEFSLKKVQAAADFSDERMERLRKNTKLLDYSAQSLKGRTVSMITTDDSGSRVELRISPDEVMYKLMWKQIPTMAKRIDLM